MTHGLLAIPAPGLIRSKPAIAVSGAATVLALYVFLVVGRFPEIVTPLQRFRPIFLTGLVAIAMAFTVPPRPRDGVFRFVELRILLALCALAVLGIPFSVWPSLSARFVVNGLSKLVLFVALVLHCVRTLEEVRRLAWAFVVAALTLSLAALLMSDRVRVSVTSTYDPNDIAFVVICALPLSVCLALDSKGLWRCLAGLTALLALAVVVQTRSRGGFLSATAVIILLVLRLPGRRPLARILPLVAGAVILAAVASNAYWDRMATIWGSEVEHASEYDEGGIREARLTIWLTGLRLMLENPLLGVGVGAFSIAEGLTHGTGIWRAAHNSFIQVGAELGLGGLALFVFLLLRTVLNCRAVIREVRHHPGFPTHLWLAHGIQLSVLAYAIAGSALSQGYSLNFYLFLALSAVLRRVTAPPSVGAPPIVAGGGLP